MFLTLAQLYTQTQTVLETFTLVLTQTSHIGNPLPNPRPHHFSHFLFSDNFILYPPEGRLVPLTFWIQCSGAAPPNSYPFAYPSRQTITELSSKFCLKLWGCTIMLVFLTFLDKSVITLFLTFKKFHMFSCPSVKIYWCLANIGTRIGGRILSISKIDK